MALVEKDNAMAVSLCDLTQDDVDRLLELVYGKKGDHIVLSSGYRLDKMDVVEFVEERRWAYINMLVVMHHATGRFYGFYYEVPATELQDSQDEWSYITPELVPVQRVPTYTYKEV